MVNVENAIALKMVVNDYVLKFGFVLISAQTACWRSIDS